MAADYDGCDPYASKGRNNIILQLEGSFKNAHDKGEVEAFSSDQVVLIGQVILRGNERQYYLSEEMFSFEPFALALGRGDADFQLVADRALSQLNRSGQIIAIYRKWFGRIAEEPLTILKALYQLNATPE